MGHDLITIYWLKAVEYVLAVSYLPLFVLFWRLVNPKEPAVALPAQARRPTPQLLDSPFVFAPVRSW